MTQGKCLVCKQNAEIEGPFSDSRTSPPMSYSYKCNICGSFLCSHSVKLNYGNTFIQNAHLLSGFLRNYSARNNDEAYFLDDEFMKNIINNGLNDYPFPKTIQDKLDCIMYYLRDMSTYPSEVIGINYNKDYPIAYCLNANEFHYFIQHLRDRELIVQTTPEHYQISVAGWEYLQQLEKININSKKAFIAMNFSDEFKRLYKEGIKPAFENTEFEPINIAELDEYDPDSEKKIDDRIIAEIKRSRFMIADFSGQRQNVYYEAGFARGLGLKVINCCIAKEVDNKDLHFDTDHYPHIKWDYDHLDDFIKVLHNRIIAEIGEGPV